MKKFLMVIISLLILSYGFLLLKEYSQNKTKERIKEFCFSSMDAKELLGCVEMHQLTPQDQYDIFYYKAEKIEDPRFNTGFALSYTTCAAYKIKGQCDLHDEYIYDKRMLNCFDTNEYRCLIWEMKSEELSEKNIRIFNSTVNNLIKLKKYENSCVKEFYEKLSIKDKNLLDSIVIEECNKK